MDKTTAAPEEKNIAEPSHRPPMTLLPRTLVSAAAAVAVAVLISPATNAATLGAVTVQSALGEPLRAEIQIPQLSSEEAATLNVRMGSPSAFAAAGVSYNTNLSGARISLQRRANGDAYLRITTERPINEPVLGMVIEADWASGQITRDYTMLLDPPKAETTTAAQAAPAPAPSKPEITAAPAPAPATPPVVGQAEQVTPAPAPAPAPRQKTTVSRNSLSQRARSDRITIQSGDTASEIAVAHGLQGVSLDQMLLAMLRANPNAFIQGNVNLVRAGAVIQMPSAEQARTTSRDEARRTVLAQTQDFEAYRSGLARNVRTTQETPGSAAVEGAVEPQVADTQQERPQEDRLEISKGGAPDGAENAATVAQSRQAEEQTERVAELDRNISELSELEEQLSGTTEAASSETTDTPEAAKATEVEDAAPDAGAEPDPAETVAADERGESSASDADESQDEGDTSAQADDDATASATTDTSASESTETDGANEQTEAEASDASVTETADDDVASSSDADASDEASETTAAPQEGTDGAAQSSGQSQGSGAAIPASMPMEQPDSLVDKIGQYRWPIIAILVALLALFGIGRSRKRKTVLPEDDGTPGTALPPAAQAEEEPEDTAKAEQTATPAADADLLPASDDEDVATSASAFSDTAFALDAPESEAAADGDLVEEADIYAEYGHDEKAEELLNQALQAEPDRADILPRLAAIHARRNDKAALATVASQALAVTGGSGVAWEAIAQMGRDLDPQNALYKSDEHTDTFEPEESTTDADDASASDAKPTGWTQTEKGNLEFLSSSADTDAVSLDFDIDFGENTKRSGVEATSVDESATSATAEELQDLAAKLQDGAAADTDHTPQELAPTPGTQEETLDLDISFSTPENGDDSIDFGSTIPLSDTSATTAPDSGTIEFNLDDFDLVDDAVITGSDAAIDSDADLGDDPLATKLALAAEFQAIGDKEGAQSMAREVAETATGALKEKAEAFLKTLGNA